MSESGIAGARFATVVLVLASIVLAVIIAVRLITGASAVEAGRTVPLTEQPYGLQHTVTLPGSEVTLRVGDPVRSLPVSLVETPSGISDDAEAPGAPSGGRLVPVSWSVRALGGFSREPDDNPVVLTLVAGRRGVELDAVLLGDTSSAFDALEPRSVAVAVDGEVDLADVSVEVSYDGLTQTLDPSSGEIDAGVAQDLYDDDPSYETGCAEVEDDCDFVAADPTSPVRPYRGGFTASGLSTYPYDERLGWAADGHLWTTVRIQIFGFDGTYDDAGRYRRVARSGAAEVTLDGADVVLRRGLHPSDFDSFGYATFEVADGTVPRELAIALPLTLRGPAAPRTLDVVARLDLTPVGG